MEKSSPRYRLNISAVLSRAALPASRVFCCCCPLCICRFPDPVWDLLLLSKHLELEQMLGHVAAACGARIAEETFRADPVARQVEVGDTRHLLLWPPGEAALAGHGKRAHRVYARHENPLYEGVPPAGLHGI